MDGKPEIVATCAGVMREHALSLEIDEGEGFGPVCDIVGTGGDGHNTFNVSTTAGIVASGAGARVFKVRRSYSYSLHSDLQLKERKLYSMETKRRLHLPVQQIFSFP